MKITYTCSEEDFVRATKLLVLKRQRRLLAFSGICLLVLLYVVVQTIASAQFRALLIGDSWPQKVVGFGMPLFICLTPLFVLRASRRVYRKSPVIGETRTLTFDGDGYSSQAASASGQVAWSVYDSFYEDKNSFLLMQKGSQVFVPIPKRELAPAEIMELRSLFENQLQSK